jgi:osmotically-inducible protein OsmY
MKTVIRSLSIAAFTGAVLITSGCAVFRDQQTVGEYVTDATLTTRVKAKMVEDKTVDAAAISVETLNGTVQLSGFAKNANEKAQAERLAASVNGVKSVRNNIIVR